MEEACAEPNLASLSGSGTDGLHNGRSMEIPLQATAPNVVTGHKTCATEISSKIVTFVSRSRCCSARDGQEVKHEGAPAQLTKLNVSARVSHSQGITGRKTRVVKKVGHAQMLTIWQCCWSGQWRHRRQGVVCHQRLVH